MATTPIALTRTRLRRDDLLEAMAGAAVVVTANVRLSRHLNREYEHRMLAQGRSAWVTPAVLPLGAWLLDTFMEAGMDSGESQPRILSPEQEEQVWSSIIHEDGPGLLRVAATARRVRAAWKSLCDWRLQLADRRFGDNETCEAFRRWALRFQSACTREGFVSESDIPRLLIPLVEQGECRLPQRLMLAGFYELSPALERLVAALISVGCDAEWVERSGMPGQAGRLRANDGAQEMQLAAAWARRILLAEPQSRIGIVVPDLAARRSSLTHVLAKTLDPASLRSDSTNGQRPWNLSLGRPLADYPVVRTALDLLALMQQPVEAASLGVLLGSPHWALPGDSGERRAELNRRSLLDRRIRSIGDVELPLSSVRYEAGRIDAVGGELPWSCPKLAARLERLLATVRELPVRASCGVWAATFSDWLSQAGWPQGRPLDSAAFQTVEAWGRLLSLFGTLGDFSGALSCGEALALFRRLAADKVFQPETADAPVQVLGLHEANGLEFDRLWVMGLHDGVWPPEPGPDPFIPLTMQRQAGMPNCDPERDRAWAARVTEHLCACAPELLFSFPGREGDEERTCSPLIAGFPALGAGGLLPDPESPWQDIVRGSVTLQTAPVHTSLPLRSGAVAGGCRLFRNQAACPFRAFAEQRLGARPLDCPQLGLGARRSGTLMHRVLESLWRELQTQTALLALDEAGLRKLVRCKVVEALEQQRRRSPATLPSRYLALETERMVQRVMAWLEIERQRSPFRVLESEQQEPFETGAVKVRLSIDRIDELEDGTWVVLDYKTGKVAPSGWFGARPDDPQLPLYGVAACTRPDAPPLAAVAFAQIRPDSAGFNGVVREAGILPGLPAGRKGPLQDAVGAWPAVLNEWSATLEQLAVEFREGTARVDPKNGPRTCRESHCELAALCRVRERLPGDGDDPEPDGDGGAEDAADG